MKRFCVPALFLCVWTGGLLADDNAIARLYFQNARTLVRAAARVEALELLDKALLFRPMYSDALLLQSRILAEETGGRPLALEAARKAVNFAAWETYGPGEGGLRLAALLADSRRYEEALKILDGLPPETLREADYFILKFRCYRGLGQTEKRDAVLKTGLAAFPAEPRLLEFFFQTTEPLSPAAVARFALLDKKDARSLPAFAAYILASKSADNLLALATEYFAAGGNDPAVSCVLIEQGAGAEREIERFVKLGGLRRIDLLRTVFLSTRRTSRLAVDFLAAFTGLSFLDADGDRIAEERFHIKDGVLLRWEIDRDQDGTAEMTVDFSASPEARFAPLPARVDLNWGANSRMSCLYASYPYIDKILMENDDRVDAGSPPVWGAPPSGGKNKVLCRLVPAACALAVLEGKSSARELYGEIPWLGYVLKAPAEFPSPERAAFYLAEQKNSFTPDYSRRMYFEDGKPRRLDFVYENGGKETVLSRLIFENGKISRGLRDLDGDGTFDAEEFYHDGRLRFLDVDTTGDGKPDYAESYFPDVLKEWDFDGDGRVDASEVWGFIHYFGLRHFKGNGQ